MPPIDDLLRTMDALLRAMTDFQLITGHTIAEIDRDHLENRCSEVLLQRVDKYAAQVQIEKSRSLETLLFLQHFLDKQQQIVQDWRPAADDSPYDP